MDAYVINRPSRNEQLASYAKNAVDNSCSKELSNSNSRDFIFSDVTDRKPATVATWGGQSKLSIDSSKTVFADLTCPNCGMRSLYRCKDWEL